MTMRSSSHGGMGKLEVSQFMVFARSDNSAFRPGTLDEWMGGWVVSFATGRSHHAREVVDMCSTAAVTETDSRWLVRLRARAGLNDHSSF
jgi:hypothetical protein